MPLALDGTRPGPWRIRKIAVVGPGIVGMPMAAMLAHGRIREGQDDPAPVVVIQRPSPTSGWKVDAINAGRSPIGGVEPDLDRIVGETVNAGLLRAAHGYEAARDADVVLVCVQTDKRGTEPDYGPLFEAVTAVAEQLALRPAGNLPLIVFESTLAPSSMATVIRERFGRHGLRDGRDVLLGNSPNRVMPGRLVERVASSDKIVAGLHPAAPELIARLYSRIIRHGTLHLTNSLTAEVVKTLENAYRDVRIAYSAEVVRYCDARDIDFYRLRDAANAALAQTDGASDDPGAIPIGGLLVPTVGVGGHCLPKDGVLLLWRLLEAGADVSRSLILEARRINDESPARMLQIAEERFGRLAGRRVALLGAAYRADSEDTRNSPSLALARLALDRGARVMVHDPYVYPTDQNLARLGLAEHFTRDLSTALEGAEISLVCTGHKVYDTNLAELLAAGPGLGGVVDGCNLYRRGRLEELGVPYAGIGRGRRPPPEALVEAVIKGFRAVETGVANELAGAIEFLNQRYADDGFTRIDFATVQRLAGTCVTGCRIANRGAVAPLASYDGFESRLAARAVG